MMIAFIDNLFNGDLFEGLMVFAWCICIGGLTHPVFAQPLNLPSLSLRDKEGVGEFVFFFHPLYAAGEEVEQRSVVGVSQLV